VTHAAVTVNGTRVGEIGPGLVVLLGVTQTDGPDDVAWLARRVAGLRVFADADGRMNLDLASSGGAALVVPQFTLYGDARRGQRPDFTAAARPEHAEPLCVAFCDALARTGLRVERGVFRAHMVVELVNDGPVTLMVESPASSAASPGAQP
jgi:D-tyrosyl-tRNA(Tyr) deacylase